MVSTAGILAEVAVRSLTAYWTQIHQSRLSWALEEEEEEEEEKAAGNVN